MHSIDFITIQWQNLLSYGSNISEISLNNNGITWIKGPNGAGKSTIIEALTVALFGESYRKIPQKELLNAANKGKLMVRLVFDRTDTNGKVRYAILRELGRSGSMLMTLSIIDEIEKIEKKPAGISQKMLEDEILGFNKNLFENVISWNSIQTKSFIDMSSEDKRKLIESIIALHIDKIKKLNSTEANLYSSKFNDATNDVTKFRNRIADLEIAKQTLLREQQDDITQLETDIQNLSNALDISNKQLSDLKDSEKKIISSGTELKTKYDAYGDPDALMIELVEYESLASNEDDNSDEISRLNGIIESSNASIKLITEEIDSIVTKIETFHFVENTTNFREMELKVKELRNHVMYISGSIRNKHDELEHIKTENDALATGIPCSMCGKPSTEDDIETIRKSLRDKWKTINGEKKKLECDVVTINKSIEILTERIENYEGLVAETNKKKGELAPFILGKKQATDTIESINKRTKAKIDRISKLRISLGNPIDTSILKKKLDGDSVGKKKIADALNVMRTDLSLNKQNQLNISKQIETINKSIDGLTQRLTKRRNTDSGSSVALNEAQLEKANTDLKDSIFNMGKYSDEVEIIKFIDEMYGDDGIKKFVLGMFVPTLNQVISHNISLFSLPFAIEFDDSLDHSFIGKFGMSQVYKGLSQGQQRKLNFCISMAFSDFVSLIADFKINIMFLDEVLDVSTDFSGLSDMINLVKLKNKDIPNIYLMSHRGEDFEDEWNHVLEVSHDGMYSKVEQIR